MEPTTGRRTRILVVDDDPSSAEALAALLREEGHEATVGGSGADTMAALASGTCELLLVDPSLRDLTGPRLLSYAQQLGVPQIVVTSDPTYDPERAPATRAGAFMYKPVHLPTLLSLIASTVSPRPAA